MQSRDIAVGVRQHRRAAKTGRQVIDRAARADPMPVAIVSVRRIRNLQVERGDSLPRMLAVVRNDVRRGLHTIPTDP